MLLSRWFLFSQSYNAYPVNMDVVSWLGLWYARNELWEEVGDGLTP